ncbi:membrane-binding protein [Adhaeribacter aquaticus]|uniref:membrane-binding protein n=1 Tax=Adhaeribacter aquaticus TaxID=299567 RepID=UPI0003FA1A1F|nr:membrane-binding protein [Adhaeribacter aquaticus]
MKKAVKQGLVWLMTVVALMQAPQAIAETSGVPTSTSASAPKAGARDIIKEIIDVVGLKPRFELREANIDNAAAVIYGGQRYILYNRQFVAAVNNAVKTDWAAVSILAHEIGHHLNGHTLSRGGSNHQDELEADEFSGFVLRKMGASLADAQAAIGLLSDEEGSHTHPGRSTRLASISKGWQSADEQIIASANTRPSNRPVALRQPAPSSRQTVATTPSRTVSQRGGTAQNILGKINFSSLPNEKIYVTANMNVVRVKGDGEVETIGKISKTNNQSYPFVLKSNYFESLFIGNNGYVLNQNGQRVGFIS